LKTKDSSHAIYVISIENLILITAEGAGGGRCSTEKHIEKQVSGDHGGQQDIHPVERERA